MEAPPVGQIITSGIVFDFFLLVTKFAFNVGIKLQKKI